MALSPPGWVFESRHDVGRDCRHDPYDVRVVGNVDRYRIWRCMACLNEVVPVPPGWVWDRRRQEHIHPATQAANRAAGHPARYWAHEPPEGWGLNADLIPRRDPIELDEWLREAGYDGQTPIRVA